MQAIFALPALTPAALTLNVCEVGGLVENFGSICRVIAADDGVRGVLLQIVAGGGKGQKYYANPEKCRPVR